MKRISKSSLYGLSPTVSGENCGPSHNNGPNVAKMYEFITVQVAVYSKATVIETNFHRKLHLIVLVHST